MNIIPYASWRPEFDSRLKNPKNEKRGSAGPFKSQNWEPAYCYCGRGGAYVTKGTPFIYQCNDCFFTNGPLPLQIIYGTEKM